MPKQHRLHHAYATHYSAEFAGKVCREFFEAKETICGSEIVELSPCKQLNLMIIKSLFESWQEQLEQLSGVPFFDYTDEAVQAALQEFMNSLSQAIKIRRADFEPLLAHSVEKTLQLAVEPKLFMEREIAALMQKSPPDFSSLRKYIKWHADAWRPVVDLLSDSPESTSWKELLYQGFAHPENLLSVGDLLAPLHETLRINLDELMLRPEIQDADSSAGSAVRSVPEKPGEEQASSGRGAEEEADPSDAFIDPALAWARFESEEHAYMKGSIGHLREGMGINQRIMFTKRLFQGNQDLLDQALEELDRTESFFDAVSLLNASFVGTLKWDVQSDEVQELLQLIFRKFDGD
ncbi:hypothetical protein [Cyclobacterium xiamenense]|jgi:hypothetical protein|uniref:hypothetical protein n=1 Tax=Cyclobacterium xiamenense TaxID=1297121 RepID=UPI0035D004B2